MPSESLAEPVAGPSTGLFKKRKRAAPPTGASSSGENTTRAAATASANDIRPPPRAPTSEDDDDDQASASVVRIRKNRSGGGAAGAGSRLSASTGIARRHRKSGSDDDDDDDEDGEGGKEWVDRFGETIHETGTTGTAGAKRRRGIDGLLEGLDEESQRYDGMAKGRGINGADEDEVEEGSSTYKGMRNYASYLPTASSSAGDSRQSANGAASKGPIRAPTHIRTVTTFDYQPDICKDYKETGYCGFGDTCKFLHDRSDYLAGWQMEAAALPNSHARRDADAAGEGDSAEEDEEEEIPFACLICRKPFTDPIVTRCGHYFCSACAIKRFAKTSKCFACGAQTGGLFNSAAKVIKRMERRKQDREEVKQQKRNRWLPAGEKVRGEGEDGEEGEGEEDFGIEGVEVAQD